MEVAKRPFYQKWWFWAIVAAFLIRAILAGEGKSMDQPVAAKEVPAAAQPAQDKPKEPAGGKGEKWAITAAEFGAIQNGMTYRELVEATGMLGKLVSEAGEKGTAAHTMMFEFEGEGKPGANAVVTLQGGKVIAKAQAGLE